jgi:type I site-specific restriction endonuclease
MWNREFDVVVIDEATQALEAECWIALLKAKKAILVITMPKKRTDRYTDSMFHRQVIIFSYHPPSKHL